MKIAFQTAAKRNHHVTLVDKANVLATSKLWRRIANQVAKEFPEISFDSCYVDAAAMKIISAPEKFDVIVTENLFGDILSDEAAQITGSLGTIPSISRGAITAQPFTNQSTDQRPISQEKELPIPYR